MIKENTIIVGKDVFLTVDQEDKEQFVAYLEDTMNIRPSCMHAAAKAYMLVLDIKQVCAIHQKKDGALAGWVTVSNSEDKCEGELNIYLLDGYKNRGYGSDAISSIVDHLAVESEVTAASVRFA